MKGLLIVLVFGFLGSLAAQAEVCQLQAKYEVVEKAYSKNMIMRFKDASQVECMAMLLEHVTSVQKDNMSGEQLIFVEGELRVGEDLVQVEKTEAGVKAKVN